MGTGLKTYRLHMPGMPVCHYGRTVTEAQENVARYLCRLGVRQRKHIRRIIDTMTVTVDYGSGKWVEYGPIDDDYAGN